MATGRRRESDIEPDCERGTATPRGQDKLRPARGLLNGLGLSLLFWGVVALGVYLLR